MPGFGRHIKIDGYEMDVTYCNETGELAVRGRSPIAPYDRFYFEVNNVDEIPDALKREVMCSELDLPEEPAEE